MSFLDKLKGLFGQSKDKATVASGDSAEKTKTEDLSGRVETPADKGDLTDKGNSPT
jgi:hypothetical protein